MVTGEYLLHYSCLLTPTQFQKSFYTRNNLLKSAEKNERHDTVVIPTCLKLEETWMSMTQGLELLLLVMMGPKEAERKRKQWNMSKCNLINLTDRVEARQSLAHWMIRICKGNMRQNFLKGLCPCTNHFNSLESTLLTF